MNEENGDVKILQVGAMTVEIHPNRKAMGAAAAKAAAESLKQLGQTRDAFGVIFATGASQIDTLEALTAIDNLPWGKVSGFHMDEYIGLPADHPASFRGYLRKRLTGKVPMKEFFEVDGTTSDPQRICQEYAEKLRSANPQLCLLGIGENGHLAFNDPDVADFNDPLDVKIVHLDAACRHQQAAEGWFATPQDVPGSAITLTIPTLLRVPRLIASVPGSRKAKIMRRVLEEAISTKYPATIMRNHPGATVYLDQDSAAELGDFISANGETILQDASRGNR